MGGRVVVVAGPTAVGKTEIAIAIAKAFDGEIVSCDSMQLYRGLDIGSAKPSAEELAAVPHHLIGVVDPHTPFSVAMYQKLARAAIREILARGRLPVVAGGTGLYLNSLLYEMNFAAEKQPDDDLLRRDWEEIAAREGPAALHERLRAVDPAAAERIHPNNVRKVVRALESATRGVPVGEFKNLQEKVKEYDAILIGLTRDRKALYDRIDRRAAEMMRAGLVEEVRGLLEQGLTADDTAMQGIGYKEVVGYLAGAYDLDEALARIQLHTRHYAKRQLTWFRRYADMTWFNLSEYGDAAAAEEAIIAWLRTA